MSDAKQFHRRTPWTSWAVAGLLALVLLPGAGLAIQQSDGGADKKDPASVTTRPAQALKFVGAVRDKATHKPIEGATVTVHREVANNPTRWEKLAPDTEYVTDKEGHFTIDVPAEQAGAKHFCLATEVRHPKYASLNWEGLGLSLLQDEIKRGEEPWFANLELTPGEEVTGTIEDPQGKALANCEISYRSIAGDGMTAALKTGADMAMGSVKTDETGRFRFNLLKGSTINGMWVKPAAYAISYQRIGAKRGELGRFWVKPGAKVTGTLRDESGKTLGGVEIQMQSEKRVLLFMLETDRITKTDEQGQFAFGPVLAGKYVLHVEDSRFMTLPLEVSLESNKPLALHPSELVTVRLKFVDSKEKPMTRYSAGFGGSKGQEWYSTHAMTNGEGIMELRVPKLDRAEVMLMRFPGTALEWRRGQTKELDASHHVKLEPLYGDVTDITVIEYKSPTLSVRAVGTEGKAITDFAPKIQYVEESLRMKRGGWINGSVGDVNWETRHDQSRETDGLVPDREFVLTVGAKGFAPVEQKLKLAEGEKRELKVELKPVATASK